VFLRELYRCPIVNLFEYFYHAPYNDMGFRQDFPPSELRTHGRNAMMLMDLNALHAGLRSDGLAVEGSDAWTGHSNRGPSECRDPSNREDAARK